MNLWWAGLISLALYFGIIYDAGYLIWGNWRGFTGNQPADNKEKNKQEEEQISE